MAITKNRVAIDIDIDKGNLIKRVRRFIYNIVETSVSITKYILIAWVVFVLTTNAIQFIETTMIIFDEFLVKEWAAYKVGTFVEVTLGLGYDETWIPVEEACSVIVGVN